MGEFAPLRNGAQVQSSAPRATLSAMELTEREVEGIPRGNGRVPPDEFVAVWAAQEQLSDENSRRGVGDCYLTCVLKTCRWIACAAVPSITAGSVPVWAPITHRTARAHEELIEAELPPAQRRSI